MKIKCELCGEAVHHIGPHLKNVHGAEAPDPCTLEEYQQRFPSAPLMSERFAAAFEERQAKKAAAVDAPKTAAASPSIPLSAKEPLAKLFGLGNARAAKNSEGKDVMISVCTQTDHVERIPAVDAGYVYNIEILKNILMAIELRIPVYIYGPSGTGKSSLLKQICAATRRRLIRVQHSVNLEEAHLLGKWMVKEVAKEDGSAISVTEFQPGPLAMAMRYGWTYLADEYDRADSGVLSIYQAVLEGEPLVISDASPEWMFIEPHPDFRIVATGNTNGSGDETGLYQATIQQDAANMERFGVVQRLDYPGEAEEIASIVARSGVSEQDAKAIRKFAADIRDKHPAQFSIPLGVRVVINIARIGLAKTSFIKAVELCFANRLPEAEREAALQYANRILK